MFMIIGLHALGKGGALSALSPPDPDYFFAVFLESLCIVAVNCFVLMSGYFGIRFSVRKILPLLHQVWFYSLGITAVFFVAGYPPAHDPVRLVSSVFPILTGQWWFITVYLSLYCIAPFLTLLINAMSRKQHILLLCLGGIFLSLLPTFFVMPINNEHGYSLWSFVFLYLLGAFIGRYTTGGRRTSPYLAIYLLLSFLTAAASVLCALYAPRFANSLFRYDTVAVVGASIALLLLFRQFRFSSPLINTISPGVLAVYIIHDHPLMRTWLWQDFFRCPSWVHTDFFALGIAGIMIGVFCSCMSIEWLRLKLFGGMERALIEAELRGWVRIGGWLQRLGMGG